MTASRWFQVAIGVLAAEYLRLVWKTNRFVIEPPNGYERFDSDPPGIAVFWHGQHLMTPFLSRRHRVKVIISRHRDGEINAIAAERLGIGTIRGSGSHSGDFFRKGGPRAFRAMLEALEQGYNVASTADVPKVSRIASLGIVKLAAASGRPIFPGRDRHQPLQAIEFVGSLRHQSPVRARRYRLGRPDHGAARRRRRYAGGCKTRGRGQRQPGHGAGLCAGGARRPRACASGACEIDNSRGVGTSNRRH
jgi:lysophospholipid acyltransferase (LPLAT)-like uncharacterized protein